MIFFAGTKSMSILLSKPSAVLSDFVKQYWFIDSVVSDDARYMQRIVPSGLPELMFFQGSRPSVVESGRNLESDAVISGHHKSFFDFQITDSFSLFAVTFQPHGLRVFFDVPGSEFQNNKVPLRLLLKEEASEIEERIASETDFCGKVNWIETYLLKQLRKRSEWYEFKRLDYCLGGLIRKKGLISVEELASQAFLSRKQFERKFSDFVGTSPKLYLRIVRFQNAIHQKAVNPHLNMTELAYGCGFYDQSHMVNEFKKLSGLTPKEYFSVCEPVSDLYRVY
ncbi:helix-turn-helix transcriptional regulator [Marinilabilia rubra]|nr:helix-turn-helix transcriptional regulator [Marinilabilia rubra]